MKIDKNVPMPELGTRRKKYPFSEMVHGDSFFIECSKEDSSRIQTNVLSSFRSGNRHKGKRIVSRKEDVGVRFWIIVRPEDTN